MNVDIGDIIRALAQAGAPYIAVLAPVLLLTLAASAYLFFKGWSYVVRARREASKSREPEPLPPQPEKPKAPGRFDSLKPPVGQSDMPEPESWENLQKHLEKIKNPKDVFRIEDA